MTDDIVAMRWSAANQDDLPMELRVDTTTSYCKVSYYDASDSLRKTDKITLTTSGIERYAKSVVTLGKANAAETWFAKKGVMRLALKASGNGVINNIEYHFVYAHQVMDVGLSISFPPGLGITLGSGYEAMFDDSDIVYC